MQLTKNVDTMSLFKFMGIILDSNCKLVCKKGTLMRFCNLLNEENSFFYTCLNVVVISAHAGKPLLCALLHFNASLITSISWRLKKIFSMWQARNIPTIPIKTTAKLSSSRLLAWWFAVTRPHVLCLLRSILSLISL